jgi:hypothetical protein
MPKDIWTSISAFENAFGNDGTTGGCVRRWWFDKVVKLSKPTYAATRFGDVFHAVLARFYMADDRGLDATGKPVNLYPDGWKSIKSRFQKDDDVVLAEEQISDLDEALIRVLVDKAITEGVLVRIPGRLVEREITRPLYKDPLTGQKIVLKGFIDLETCRSVEDHKTAKDTKWLVTVNKLRNNVQMIVYAWDKYERGYEGLLWLTHNNFIKDYNDPQVIQRTVQVDKEYVYNYFNTVILPKFRMMLGIYQKYPASAVEKWRDLCPPNNPERECNHYYGHSCPYISICTGQCSVALYRAKYEDLQEQQTLNSERVANMGLVEEIKRRNALVNPAPVASPQASATPTPANTGPVAGTPVNPLDVLAKVRAMQAAQQQPVAAPVAPPVAQAAPGATVAATPVDNRPKAPWHYEGCVACRDNPYGGFNSQGSPCNICDAQNEQAGRLKSTDYSWVYDAQNNLVFTQNPGATPTFPERAVEVPTATPTAPPAAIPPAPVEKVVKTRKPRTPKVQTAAPVATPPTLTPAPPQADAVPVTDSPCAEGNGTSGGITLLIGCTFFKDGGAAILTADDVLVEVIRTIETAFGKKRTEIEHFALMSAIDVAIPEIAAELSEAGVWVTTFSPTKGTALARLVDGLRPFANKVIVNIGA